MIAVLAHALPVSIGALPLTLVLTAMLGAYLAVGAISTRRAAARVGVVHAGARRQVGGGDRAAPVDQPGEPAAEYEPGPRPSNLVGVGLLLALALLASAGARDASTNLTDRVVLEMLWGAVAISSIAVGGWWAQVDPFPALAGGIARATGDPDHDLAHPLPGRIATAAMLAGLLAWAWAQLLATPSVPAFQMMLIGYVAVHVLGTMRYGLAWLEEVEPLRVVSSTLGLLRPGGGGPLARLVALPDDPRTRAVCAVLIGWSLADLVTEAEGWHHIAAAGGWLGPLVLFGAVALVGGLITAVSSRFRLGSAFVAVAGAWVFAHYLSVLLIEGQGLLIWLSDPFATGADLFGRRETIIDPEPLPLWVMAVIQSVPFVAGHLLAVAVVQRRAAALVRTPGQVGAATFFARTLIAALLLGGSWLQLGGV